MSAILTRHNGITTVHTRTEKGVAYDLFMKEVRKTLGARTVHEREELKKMNIEFMRCLRDPQFRADYLADAESRQAEIGETRAVSPHAVHVDSLLADVSVMYANDNHIGEQLMPVVPVVKLSGLYATYDKRDRFAAPDDAIGPRGKANEIHEGRGTGTYLLEDRGLSNFLDYATLQNQDAPFNEMVDLVVGINDRLSLKRENRILTEVADSGNYSGNTAAAATFWDDSTGGSVISDIAAADAEIWHGPNPVRKIGFTSLSVWNTAMINNPELRNLFQYVREGLVTTQAIAQYFGLDDILVSRVRHDTANEGQTASYARLMTGEVFGIVTVADSPGIRSAHWGSTFRKNDMPLTTQWEDPSIGTRGGIYARVSVSEQHKVIAGDAGYLITNILT